MCGVAFLNVRKGVLSNNKLRRIRNTLFLDIQSRGRDACGVATIDNRDNQVTYYKNNVPVPEFLTDTNLTGSALVGNEMILHTRAATQGSPTNNKNNHPIVTDRVVLVHNGMLSNYTDDKKTLNLTDACTAEVDTELIPRYIDTFLATDTPNTYRDNMNNINGDATIMWFNLNDMTMRVSALGGRPLHIGEVFFNGESIGFIGASTVSALEDVNKLNIANLKISEIKASPVGKEHVYCDGEQIEYADIKQLGSKSKWSSQDYLGGGGGLGRGRYRSYDIGYDTYATSFNRNKPHSLLSRVYVPTKYFKIDSKIEDDVATVLQNMVTHPTLNHYDIENLPSTTWCFLPSGFVLFANNDAEELKIGRDVATGCVIVQCHDSDGYADARIAFLPDSYVNKIFIDCVIGYNSNV